jgi:hypothetical protein
VAIHPYNNFAKFGSKQTYGRKKIPYYWHNGPDCRIWPFFLFEKFPKVSQIFEELKSQTQKKEKTHFSDFQKTKSPIGKTSLKNTSSSCTYGLFVSNPLF